MSFEITGKLVVKYETAQKSETFKTREFVIEKTEDIGGRSITNYIKFQCVQDKTAMPDRFNIGDDIKVSFNIKGTKWAKEDKESYFTNLDAWRMETIKLSNDATSEAPPSFTPPPPQDELVDDLPF
jgi:hypothetical protein